MAYARWQAEAADLSGSVGISDAFIGFGGAGWTGSGYADFGSAAGSTAVTYDAPYNGTYRLQVRYASGFDRPEDPPTKPIEVLVDGAVVHTFNVEPTGPFTPGFGTYVYASVAITLAAGAHTLALGNAGEDTANVDYLEIWYEPEAVSG